jgi:hypothetical protein
MPNHGFETLYNVQLSDKLKLQNITVVALETGFKWKTTKKTALYTGIFMDVNYAFGVKLGFSFGSGHPMGIKPMPLLGD